ncbi:hypothetical protein CWB89_12630 [Pseudoalteromonas piscicida]|uniref:Uncharacterized protein n=2 Tax=Pseudoalteromonas TaxID=53246 RepID=A0AAQ2EPS6_PSEO7|nr:MULTISPECIES: hypothetical protein [Pseudoalteromonas]KJY83811.1 hypothetical protein TW75_21180 [Pseudoalteromonas piscicida]MDP4489730.1 hypothetical protein [Pseudoalteromonas piscicida]TMN35369.1 hypothetical protein CWB95_19015 [Pseudoalteromonas piscicida]TMN38037.1 hypothetical protein CWB94_15230 [Pseudoalteromonas piscicida]TMN47898.1 hypothetical protein CWB92_18830 [Pseudoalteromonas piscicida]
MLLAFIYSMVLIKTSLLGLGVVSIVLSTVFILALHLNIPALSANAKNQFVKSFKLVLFAHLLGYLLLVSKLLLIDGWQDVPMFIASHLIMHHIWSGLIAAILTLTTILKYQTFIAKPKTAKST